MVEALTTLVEPDEKTAGLLRDYELLVKGNNALGLEQIPEFEPLRPPDDKEVVPYQSKVQELADKVHQAAVQLNEHYSALVGSDEYFIPVWNQERTFEQIADGFPKKIKKRGAFRGFNKVFGYNDLEGRIELNKRLDYFKSFYDASSRVLSVRDMEKMIAEEKKDATRLALLLNAFLLATYAMFPIGDLIIDHQIDYELSVACTAAVMSPLWAVVATMGSLGERWDERNCFKTMVYQAKREAKKADEVIDLIKRRATE